MQDFDIIFYDKPDGTEPVKEFLDSLDVKMRAHMNNWNRNLQSFKRLLTHESLPESHKKNYRKNPVSHKEISANWKMEMPILQSKRCNDLQLHLERL